MHSATGQSLGWRFATRARPPARTSVLLIGLAASACATPRPDIELPRPRPAETEALAPDLERARPVERGSLSTVSGDIRFVRHQRADVELGEVVVTLRPKRGRPGLPTAAAGDRPVATVTASAPVFAPRLTLVRPGQPLVLANEGPVVHRLFSTELGVERAFELPPGTRSERIVPKSPGPLRFYCSLHADETFVVLVEDAPWAEVITKADEYRFGPLPPGRYTLAIWSEQVQGPVRDLVVDGYSRMRASIWLDPDLFRP